MAKPKQAPPPAPPSSSSSSSSSDSDSPPPAISALKNPPALSTTTVPQKHPNPLSKSILEAEEDKEDSETEDGSTEEDSSEDFAAKPIPPPDPTDPRIADGKQSKISKSPPPDSDSEDGEEDAEEVDSSSESEQQPLPPPPQADVKIEGNKSAAKISGADSVSDDESETSSDSDTITPPPRIPPRNTADPSLKPLSSKPMDSPVSKKRSINNPVQVSEKKRKTVHVQEKKEITRRIWSKSDELILLQCVLDFIENHNGTSSTQAQVDSLLKSQAESLLKSVNDSLSSAVTLTQMIDKIRRLRQKYNATAKKVKVNNPNISNANDAAVFALSRRIWGSGKKEPVFGENKLKTDKLKENIKEVKGKAKIDKLKEKIKEEKGKGNHLEIEYPFLRWHAKNDNVNSALVVHSRIPTREAKELEGSCKKLEIIEVQLHMKKMKLLSSSLKLIEDALAKL